MKKFINLSLFTLIFSGTLYAEQEIEKSIEQKKVVKEKTLVTRTLDDVKLKLNEVAKFVKENPKTVAYNLAGYALIYGMWELLTDVCGEDMSNNLWALDEFENATADSL